jgi:hypothetical protein
MPEPAEARIHCADCRFYRAANSLNSECMINPPTAQYVPESDYETGKQITIWPEVKSDDWCGAAKAK